MEEDGRDVEHDVHTDVPGMRHLSRLLPCRSYRVGTVCDEMTCGGEHAVAPGKPTEKPALPSPAA